MCSRHGEAASEQPRICSKQVVIPRHYLIVPCKANLAALYEHPCLRRREKTPPLPQHVKVQIRR